ncbi:MAG: 1-acyl-sn-glycerol-3-phosphate acyltransferase [Pseudomonadota bacterium]
MDVSSPSGFFSRWFVRRIRTRVSFSAPVRDPSSTATVVYVLRGRRRLDHLLMNAVALQQDLPPPTHAAGADPEQTARAFEALLRKNSVVLFLRDSQSLDLWRELLDRQRDGTWDLRLVPVGFFWRRFPGRLHPVWLDRILGTDEDPGRLRYAFRYLLHRHHVAVRFSKPLPLRDLANDPVSEVSLRRLRHRLLSAIDRERRILCGPRWQPRSRIIRAILRTQEVRKAIVAAARRKKRTERETLRRAERILREMVADYRHAYVCLAYRTVRFLWHRMFTTLNVNLEGIERIRAVAKDHPVLLTPCHKSHMDYLLLSLIFYENRIPLPHVNAGANLSFFPMGIMSRSGGAFFMRRSVLGETLYTPLLSAYIRFLIRNGSTQEFFIEGGRTRTGKVISPKTGLLTLEVDSFLDGAADELFVVPTAITYDRVPEDEGYRAELAGGLKRKETFWTMWRSRGLVFRKHGEVHVRFSDPISLKEFFSTPSAENSEKHRKGRTSELADRIVREIASETAVTRSALAATALLSDGSGIVDPATLLQRTALLLRVFHTAGAPIAETARDPGRFVPEILSFFASNGWLKKNRIDEESRLILDFYKNTTLFHLLPTAMAALLKERSVDRYREEDGEFLRRLCEEEFSEEVRPGSVEGETPDDRIFLAGLLDNYLESYRLAGLSADQKGIRFPLSVDAMGTVLSFGRELLSRGDLRRAEALSTANLKNAFAYLHKEGLLKDRNGLFIWMKRLERLSGAKRKS